ncbi:MAG TPA: hypothetical protein VK427_16565 [Kofleriaceae bacterium]|nr:hypothetical protein [Kofleriaceae bacterium]
MRIDSLPARTVTSARDGTFEIENLVGRTYEVRAQAGELFGGPQVIRLAEGSAPMTIEVHEGARVLVNVVDVTRAPVARSSVRVIDGATAATTDADGRTTLTAHPGSLAIEATARGYAPRRVSVTASTGVTSRVTIVLREGFEVSGRVVDQARTPVPYARVYALQCSTELPPPSEEEPATAVTDESGVFSIPSAVGMHMFFVTDDEHAPKLTPMFDIDRTITNVEIVMRPGAVYAGDVVDADGKPVAQARVYVDMGAGVGSRRFVASTDASGAFEIRGLPRAIGGTDCQVDALAYAISDEGISDTALVKFAEQPELRGQKLALRRNETAGVITGIVVDDTGAPVANVLVNAGACLPLAAMPSWPRLVDSSTATSTRTNARGEFKVSSLPKGDYGLWPGAFDGPPLATSCAESAADRDPWTFMTSVKTGDQAVRLVIPRAGHIIGRVAFSDTGEPVEDFTTFDGVDLVPGEHGALHLRDRRPGSYPLIINRRGVFWEKQPAVRVAAGQTVDVGTITVERGRTLRGQVVDTAGRGIAGASVRIGTDGVFERVGRFDEPTFDPSGTITDESGAFTIVDAVPFTSVSPAQALVVGATHASHGRALPVALDPGTEDPPPVTLTLLECGSIAGTVTRRGQPIYGATIDAGLPAFATASSSEDGEFALPMLPAGPVALRVQVWTDAGRDPMALLRAHQLTVEVQAGKQTSVMIEVPVGTIELGVIVAPRPGADVAGARVFLFSGTVAFENYAQLSSQLLNGVQGQADWDGRGSRPAAFERLVPGDYTVCTIPLAWSPEDQTLMKRLHTTDRTLFKVYCAPARVRPAPEQQTVTVEVPAMSPLL